MIENGFEYYKELIDTYNTFNLNIRKLEVKKQLIDTEAKIEENLLIKKANGIKKRIGDENKNWSQKERG